MKFSLIVYGAPYSTEAAATALHFAGAVIDRGHEIYRLFFISDGVHNANRLAVVPQDEVNLQSQWHELIARHGIDSTVCVSSALRRGVIDQGESERHELGAISLARGSSIAGLGQWVDAALQSDRVVSFG